MSKPSEHCEECHGGIGLEWRHSGMAGCSEHIACQPCLVETYKGALRKFSVTSPTRRERIATAVFAALFASPKEIRYNNQAISAAADHSKVYSSLAVIAADALIAELDKEPTP